MNAIALIEVPSLALDVPEEMTFDEWRDMGRKLCATERVINWWIGDWWAAGHRYGERARLAAEGIFGLSFSSLANISSVARAFETSRRREHLSFGHHAEVAPLPAAEADHLLDKAAAQGWTIRDLREVVVQGRIAKEPSLPRWFDRSEPRVEVDRGEAKEAIFQRIREAAERGDPCPTADELQEVSGVGSVSTTVALMHVLEEEQRITVTRYQRSRVVTIIDQGISTAGSANQTPHWRELGRQAPIPQVESVAQSRPDVAALIFAKARAKGKSPQAYLLDLVWLGWEVECAIDSARGKSGIGEAA